MRPFSILQALLAVPLSPAPPTVGHFQRPCHYEDILITMVELTTEGDSKCSLKATQSNGII